MGGFAVIESPSKQLYYPEISNSMQFTNQEAPQNLCHGAPNQASSAHSFSNDRSAFRHGCVSTGSLSCPSNGLLQPAMNQPEINQTVNCQMPLEKSAEHTKAKDSKNKNKVQTEGKVNKGWLEKLLRRRQWKWSNQEDMLLVQLVKQHGGRNWARIAEKLPLRGGKQCRDRWLNYLRPNIVKNAWSEEEDKLLIELHKEFGNKWACIAKMFPERTENNIKNHWNATKRRHLLSINYSNNKNIKYPSLLKDYITSITSSSSDDQINIQQKRKRKPRVTTVITTAPLEQPESSALDPNRREPITSSVFDPNNRREPITGSVFDPNRREPITGSVFDPNNRREPITGPVFDPNNRREPIPGPVFDPNRREPIPGPVFDPNRREPVPSPVFDPNRREPVPSPVFDPNRREPVPSPVFDPNRREPIPGPVFDPNRREPIPGPVFDPNRREPVPSPVFDPNRREPVPSPVFDPNRREPVPSPVFDPNRREPVPSPVFDPNRREPIPSSFFYPNRHEPITSSVFDPNRREPVPSSVFDPNRREPITSLVSFDSVNCYKPEMVFNENNVESNLVDELQFDPKAERQFMDMFCW